MTWTHVVPQQKAVRIKKGVEHPMKNVVTSTPQVVEPL